MGSGKPETEGSRACHWVLKVGNLHTTLDFLGKVLGLKVLRHEEFDSGCEATCNGPYAGAWSKTMVGFGPEEQHFALELTYNYGIESYEFGNDLQYIALHLDVETTQQKAKDAGYEYTVEGNSIIIQGPDHQNYKVIPKIEGRSEEFVCVAIRVDDLAVALDYWCGLLGLQQFRAQGQEHPSTPLPHALVGFAEEQAKLELIEVQDGKEVDHAKSGGRIAFACKKVPPIYEMVKANKDRIENPPISLPTPGKADVVVTILKDRDGYEICFVEDEAFYDLATPTYNEVDWEARAARGGDGHPPPKEKLEYEAAEVLMVTTQEELDEKVKAAGKDLVLLEFGAGWCKNCKKMKPAVEQLAREHSKGLMVVAVDIEEAQDLADDHNVSQVPYFVLLKKGERVDDYLGSKEDELKAKLAKHT